MNKVKKFYKCSCYSEALEYEVDEDQFVEICIWKFGRPGTGLFHRLRLAWQALRGILYTDEIMLDIETAKSLVEDLTADLLKVEEHENGQGC